MRLPYQLPSPKHVAQMALLQFMTAGLPVIANPVGVHGEMVRHGETGFLAQTQEEWADAVTRLQADPDLRRRMGAAVRRRVEQEYGVAVGSALWCNLLDDRQRRRKTG